jgi:hypothetical protein
MDLLLNPLHANNKKPDYIQIKIYVETAEHTKFF